MWTHFSAQSTTNALKWPERYLYEYAPPGIRTQEFDTLASKNARTSITHLQEMIQGLLTYFPQEHTPQAEARNTQRYAKIFALDNEEIWNTPNGTQQVPNPIP